MTDDLALLADWLRSRDPQAFNALAERHAGLIYGTCRRITGDHHAAEDLAQDVLWEFARSASQIRGSVAGYVHALARSRALNRVRDQRTRRRHEVAAGALVSGTADPAQAIWSEISPLLDQALAELDDDLRVPLVLHYLCGRTQAEVADVVGCDAATVSRRIARGLAQLRERLSSAGLAIAATTVLASQLEANAVESAPAVVIESSRRIGLTAAATSIAGSGWMVAAGVSALLVGTVAILGAVWNETAPTAIPSMIVAPEKMHVPALLPAAVGTTTPLLFVRDIERTVAFYVDRLDWQVVDRWDGADGDNHWRKLRLVGTAEIMVQQMPISGPDARVVPERPGEGFALAIPCTDATALWQYRLADILARPVVSGGQWSAAAVDPDGYTLCYVSRTDAAEGSVFAGAPAVTTLELGLVQRFETVIPVMSVAAVERTLDCYVEGLGFTPVESGDSGAGRRVRLQNGRSELIIEGPRAAQTTAGPALRREGPSVSIACSDAIAVYRVAKARGLHAGRPFVGNGRWVTEIIDPDGFTVAFETPATAPEDTVLDEPADAVPASRSDDSF
jgi:RNA polymerase sigma factor (sigma-70 family)